MVYLPRLMKQRRFYKENIEEILSKYNRGYVVYRGSGESQNYKFYETKRELRENHPELFDRKVRLGVTHPLVIDIRKEALKRKAKNQTQKF